MGEKEVFQEVRFLVNDSGLGEKGPGNEAENAEKVGFTN
jgi:hypothetical protein